MSDYDLTVKGRDKPSAVARVDASGVTIRLDCQLRPDFWAEIRLTQLDLECLLARVERMPEDRPLSEEGE